MARYHVRSLLLLAAIFLSVIYLHIQQSRHRDFYQRTLKAVDKAEKDKAWKQTTDERMQWILRQAEQRNVSRSESTLKVSEPGDDGLQDSDQMRGSRSPELLSKFNSSFS